MTHFFFSELPLHFLVRVSKAHAVLCGMPCAHSYDTWQSCKTESRHFKNMSELKHKLTATIYLLCSIFSDFITYFWSASTLQINQILYSCVLACHYSTAWALEICTKKWRGSSLKNCLFTKGQIFVYILVPPAGGWCLVLLWWLVVELQWSREGAPYDYIRWKTCCTISLTVYTFRPRQALSHSIQF